MTFTLAENASKSQAPIAFFSNAPICALRHKSRVLGSREILAELERRGIERKEIADVLGVDPSQVTRLYAFDDKPRKLTHDEAVRLVEKYRLEPVPEVKDLPPSVWRLVARHIASRLGRPLEEDDPHLREVAADLAALSRFFRRPQVEATIQAAQNFFETLDSYREAQSVNPEETDPQPAR